MNNKYTLKELADIGAKASLQHITGTYAAMAVSDRSSAWERERPAREAFTKAILDAIGYEFPKDEEREAFDVWCEANNKLNTPGAFEIWKAGREELLKTQALAKEPDTTEPAWIPWSGGDKSPITGKQTRYEVEYRDGAKAICVQNTLRWAHLRTAGDIIAYRILEP